MFNDTAVIKARLLGRKASGGAVEALVERVLPEHEVLAHLRASKSPQAGRALVFASAEASASRPRCSAAAGRDDALFRLRFPAEPLALLERHGHVPLPPYIAHADTARRRARATRPCSRRGPGASRRRPRRCISTHALLAALAARGVERAALTLHVGAGTFQPVRSENLAEHRMHSEWFEVRAADGRGDRAHAGAPAAAIVAVGTTSLARARSGGARRRGSRPARARPTSSSRRAFAFASSTLLVTNFHLPKSTLLMLVSAFAGHARMRALYRHAIAARYRFFSYGDAMLLNREDPAPAPP